jgi:hypothetical protein
MKAYTVTWVEHFGGVDVTSVQHQVTGWKFADDMICFNFDNNYPQTSKNFDIDNMIGFHAVEEK